MNDMAHAVLRLLEENKIDHTLAEHPAVFNMEELYAQGLEHCDAIAKNLLVRDQKKRFYWLLVLYGEKRADLKALKARLGHGARIPTMPWQTKRNPVRPLKSPPSWWRLKMVSASPAIRSMSATVSICIKEPV